MQVSKFNLNYTNHFKSLYSNDKKFVYYLLGVILQTGHTIEHYAQVVQRFWLGLPPTQSRGFIGQLDIEIVHLLWNIGVLAFLVYAHKAFELGDKSHPNRSIPLLYKLSVFNLFFQGYHTFEHIIRSIQFFVLSINPAPGVVGYFIIMKVGIDGVILMHFIINIIVYPVMLVFLIIYFLHTYTMVKQKVVTNQN